MPKKKLTLNILKKVKCDKGRIGTELTSLDQQIDDEIGEFFDLLCVALRKKPLTSFDYLDYKTNFPNVKKWLPKVNKKLINEIIDFANEKNIKALQFKKKGGTYLRTIFYYPHQKNNAYKLAYILWSKEELREPYTIGILLGYSTHNIKQYYLQNFEIKLTGEDDKLYRKEVRELKNYKEWVNDNIAKKKIQLIDHIERI
jgi:hypothetical protein